MRRDFYHLEKERIFYNSVEHMNDREIQEKIAFDTNCTRKNIEYLKTVVQVYIFITVLAVIIVFSLIK